MIKYLSNVSTEHIFLFHIAVVSKCEHFLCHIYHTKDIIVALNVTIGRKKTKNVYRLYFSDSYAVVSLI